MKQLILFGKIFIEIQHGTQSNKLSKVKYNLPWYNNVALKIDLRNATLLYIYIL